MEFYIDYIPSADVHAGIVDVPVIEPDYVYVVPTVEITTEEELIA